MTDQEIKPCPFCGCKDVIVGEGTTFRWRVATCDACGASCGEVRHNTTAHDQEQAELESRERALRSWNERTT